MPNLDGALDVFDRLFATALKHRVQLAGKLIIHGSRYADAARLSQRFQPSSNVDAITEEIIASDDNVAEVDAYAILDAFFCWHISVLVADVRLYLDGALHGIHDTRELDQQPVTGCLYETTTVRRDRAP